MPAGKSAPSLSGHKEELSRRAGINLLRENVTNGPLSISFLIFFFFFFFLLFLFFHFFGLLPGPRNWVRGDEGTELRSIGGKKHQANSKGMGFVQILSVPLNSLQMKGRTALAGKVLLDLKENSRVFFPSV